MTSIDQTKHAIEMALKSGDFPSAMSLIMDIKNETPTLQFSDRRTPLHYACQHGRVDMIEELIAKCNLSVETKDNSGCTPLHTAAQYGHLKVFKFLFHLLKAGSVKKADLLHDEHIDHEGNTPLLLTSRYGCLDIITYLTKEMGCDPNKTNIEGLSCLHLAAQHGHFPVVRFLLEEVGCDISLVDEHGRSPAYLAAGGGHLDILKYMLEEKQADAQFKTTKEWKNDKFTTTAGRSLMHTASREGHLSVLKYLVDHRSCDPSCQDKRGVTPLHLACQKGHMDIVVYLIAKLNCSSDSTCDDGSISWRQWSKTPLHYASENGHLDIVQYLIHTQCCDPSHTDENKNTPLHFASKSGYLATVKYLATKHKCDPLCKNKYNNTPLHLAALEGRLAVVKYFIEDLQCDRNSRGRWGRIPLHYASENGHLAVMQYLIDTHHCDPSCTDGNNDTPVHLSSLHGHLATVKYLTVEQKCKLSKNKENSTPLHLAALNGRLAVVKYFIEDLECDPNSKGQWGRTALHYASKNDHLSVIQYLIDTRCCNPSSRDEDESTPLHLASQKGHLTTVRYLIKHRCNPLSRNKNNNAPLHFAARAGNLAVVKYFIEDLECDPNSKGQWGRTALHYASKNDHLSVIQYLIDTRCCNPSSRDEDESTPLHLASQKGHLTTVRYLIKHRCNPLSRNKNNNAPLHFAARAGNLAVVKYFIEDLNCNPITSGQNRRIPLFYAIRYGHYNTVKYLQCKSPPTALSPDNSPPLCVASKYGHLSIVKYYVENYSYLIVPISHKLTSLDLAARNMHRDVFEYLFNEVKSHPSLRRMYSDIHGQCTLLHSACQCGSLNVIQNLMGLNYSIETKDLNKSTPLHSAAQYGQLEALKYLLQHMFDEVEYLLAYHHLQLSLSIKKLYKEAITSKHVDINGNTPLHTACIHGKINIVRFLGFQIGLDPDSFNKDHLNCLHLACIHGHLNIVKILVTEMKCDINSIDGYGRSPAYFACEKGFLDILKYLITEKGADQSITTTKLWNKGDTLYFPGLTLIHIACCEGHEEIVKYLIENCSINPASCKDDEGETPLYLACQNGHLNIAEYLIEENQCCPFITTKNKRSCIHAAKISGNQNLVDYLTKYCNSKRNIPEIKFHQSDSQKIPIQNSKKKTSQSNLLNLPEKSTTFPQTWAHSKRAENDDVALGTKKRAASNISCDSAIFLSGRDEDEEQSTPSTNLPSDNQTINTSIPTMISANENSNGMKIIRLDSGGGIYHDNAQNITIRVPEGAIPKGQVIELEYEVKMTSSLNFPEGYRFISPIIKLHIKDDPFFKFIKPIEIILPHCLDIGDHTSTLLSQISFMKAIHGEDCFKSISRKQKQEFNHHSHYGKLKTDHLCYLCIAAIENYEDSTLDMRFNLIRVIPELRTYKWPIYFYITYHLPACTKVSIIMN